MAFSTKLAEWVMDNVNEWRDHRITNYESKWNEYERLWRGEWAAEDRNRDSERSRIISPAIQQAIESHTAEVEEAIFGQGGKFFNIVDDMDDTDPSDIERMENYMLQNFKKNKIRKAIGDTVLLASVYGTGIGEIIIKETIELVPATQPLPNVDAMAIGVQERKYVAVGLRPISPMNFVIDPNATSIEEALGCAVEEFVSAHIIAQGMVDGIYQQVKLEDESPADGSIEPTQLDQPYDDDKLRVVRYYGLVPSKLLVEVDSEYEDILGDGKDEEDDEDKNELIDEYGDLVEAIVVIVNGEKVIKAEETPYMMKDRPIVAFQNDSIPGRFWGRGVGEKGYNMQKAIDAQLRSHMDSLALTSVPMMAMDATRLPRGAKYEVRPGKMLLSNGNPNETFMPFKFGNTDPGNIQTAQEFERMLMQATGTVDSASLAQNGADGLTGMSMALSGVIKKNKRTLVNFQDQFLIPFVTKAAYRFMQFDPENFKVKDFNFVPASTLGMLAREVEQAQFINLLKTLGPDSAVAPIIMMGVVENSSLANRQQLLQMLQQQMQPNPEQQQQQQMQLQMEMQAAQAQLAKIASEVELNRAKATETLVSAQVKPEETKAKVLAAINENIPDGEQAAEREFNRRVKVAELMLKESEQQQNARVVEMQMKNNAKAQQNT